MEYVVSAPKMIDGWLCFFPKPEDAVQIERDAQRFKEDGLTSLSFKKYHRKRTKSQLDLVWVIAEKMAHDENFAGYGMDKNEIYEGIRFRAVDFGYPTVEIRFVGSTKRVPKSASNDSDLSTKEMSIFIETAFLLASEAGVDVRAEKNEWKELIT